jgi:hypothetical protein
MNLKLRKSTFVKTLKTGVQNWYYSTCGEWVIVANRYRYSTFIFNSIQFKTLLSQYTCSLKGPAFPILISKKCSSITSPPYLDH